MAGFGLNTNVFMVTQAIEDASVGAELDGLSGAIRGAANNIAFLAAQIPGPIGLISQFGLAALTVANSTRALSRAWGELQDQFSRPGGGKALEFLGDLGQATTEVLFHIELHKEGYKAVDEALDDAFGEKNRANVEQFKSSIDKLKESEQKLIKERGRVIGRTPSRRQAGRAAGPGRGGIAPVGEGEGQGARTPTTHEGHPLRHHP
jgi:hypothetical protein